MNQMTWQSALGGIRNGESDYRIARSIFNDESGEHVTVAAARLADDMAEAFGAFGTIAESGDFKGARVLASFGAMAAELRRLQDSEAQLKKSEALLTSRLDQAQKTAAELEDQLCTFARYGAERESHLSAYRDAAARFTFGEMRDNGEHFRALFEAYSADVTAVQRAERGE